MARRTSRRRARRREVDIVERRGARPAVVKPGLQVAAALAPHAAPQLKHLGLELPHAGGRPPPLLVLQLLERGLVAGGLGAAPPRRLRPQPAVLGAQLRGLALQALGVGRRAGARVGPAPQRRQRLDFLLEGRGAPRGVVGRALRGPQLRLQLRQARLRRAARAALGHGALARALQAGLQGVQVARGGGGGGVGALQRRLEGADARRVGRVGGLQRAELVLLLGELQLQRFDGVGLRLQLRFQVGRGAAAR